MGLQCFQLAARGSNERSQDAPAWQGACGGLMAAREWRPLPCSYAAHRTHRTSQCCSKPQPTGTLQQRTTQTTTRLAARGSRNRCSAMAVNGPASRAKRLNFDACIAWFAANFSRYYPCLMQHTARHARVHVACPGCGGPGER